MRWALGAGLALAACSRDPRAAEAAVRAYNQAAITAYRSGDFAPLEQADTTAEWGRVKVLADLKAAARLVLESELLRLEVTKVARVNEHLLVATTAERWRYHDRPLTPGAPPGTVFVVDMTLSYDLLEASGAWRVDKVRALTSDYLEPKGFTYQAPPPHLRPDAGG